MQACLSTCTVHQSTLQFDKQYFGPSCVPYPHRSTWLYWCLNCVGLLPYSIVPAWGTAFAGSSQAVGCGRGSHPAHVYLYWWRQHFNTCGMVPVAHLLRQCLWASRQMPPGTACISCCSGAFPVPSPGWVGPWYVINHIFTGSHSAALTLRHHLRGLQKLSWCQAGLSRLAFELLGLHAQLRHARVWAHGDCKLQSRFAGCAMVHYAFSACSPWSH